MELVVVDAFTDRPFAGNPAAVAVVDEYPSDDRMQLIAREMNLSETAFVVARTDGEHDLRWFTPTVEVELCGHATLASAHVLGGQAAFHTRSGRLACTTRNGLIEMDFPAAPPARAEALLRPNRCQRRRWTEPAAVLLEDDGGEHDVRMVLEHGGERFPNRGRFEDAKPRSFEQPSPQIAIVLAILDVKNGRWKAVRRHQCVQGARAGSQARVAL